ncbi:serine hydrolase, partial [candidate division KSB1 bacterium]|nr:serine hydrolase [candidate division KSB1 bacterium]
MSGYQMKLSWKKGIVVLLLVVFHVGIFYFGSKYVEIARLGAGYKAKLLCSAVFISKRPADTVLEEEFGHPLLKYFDAEIDYENRTVTAGLFFGLIKRKATYTDTYGTILDFEKTELDTTLDIYPENSATNLSDRWQVDSNNFPPEIDLAKLNRAVAEAFNEPDTVNMRRTRAVVIVHDGKIIAERYAAPVTADTPLIGWSMAKSVTNALVGILVKKDLMDVDDPVPVPEWQQLDDPRQHITYDQMLRMTPGLEFEEGYANPRSDVIVMLFGKKDNAKFAAQKPLIHEPGTHWHYSSGTTNILC